MIKDIQKESKTKFDKLKTTVTDKTTILDKRLTEDINTIIQNSTTSEFNQKIKDNEFSKRVKLLAATLEQDQTDLV